VDAASRDKAMKDLLKNPAACDASLWAGLEGIAFVPNTAGGLCKASELYDSRKQHIVTLVDRAECFPASHFADSKQVMSIPPRIMSSGHGA